MARFFRRDGPPCRTRNCCGNDSRLCQGAWRIRRYNYGGGQHSGPDIDTVVGNFPVRSTGPGPACISASGCVGGAGVRSGVDERISFSQEERWPMKLLLRRILLPLAEFALEL